MSSRPTNSLMGVSIDDPVKSFFSFIKEREAVRLKKEAGQPKPWTHDKVLNTVKFTNIKRIDDKTTRFILDHLKDIHDPQTLILNAVFARYINLPSTLTHMGILSPDVDGHHYLTKIQECDPIRSMVYQVPVNCLGRHSKIENFFFLDVFPKSDQMLKIVQDGGSIWYMTQRLSYEVIKSGWHTVFSQALLDLSVLRPDLVDGISISYVGYGAKPALKYLKQGDDISDEEMMLKLRDNSLNTLNLTFADIEHAICEWRKWVEFTYGIRKITKRYRY